MRRRRRRGFTAPRMVGGGGAAEGGTYTPLPPPPLPPTDVGAPLAEGMQSIAAAHLEPEAQGDTATMGAVRRSSTMLRYWRGQKRRTRCGLARPTKKKPALEPMIVSVVEPAPQAFDAPAENASTAPAAALLAPSSPASGAAAVWSNMSVPETPEAQLVSPTPDASASQIPIPPYQMTASQSPAQPRHAPKCPAKTAPIKT